MSRWDRWAEKEQRRAEQENEPDRSLSLLGPGGFAHVTSVLVPLVGPIVALVLAGRDGFERQHALAAVVLNGAVLGVALAADAAFGDGILGLTAQGLLLAALLAGAVANIRRLVRNDAPFTIW